MENVDNLMLEHMKRFQAGQERIEHKLAEMLTRLGHIEISLAGIRRDVAHSEDQSASMGVRMDKLAERLERVEKRLELQP